MPDNNRRAHPSVWARIEEDISKQQQEAPAPDIWELAEERLNVAKYRPVRIANAELADVSSKAAGKRYMLRNPNNDRYVLLGEEEVFLWNLMDGQNTVKDLIMEYFAEYGSLAGQQVLLNLLSLLKSNGFFKEKPAPVTQSLMMRLQRKKRLAWVMSAVGFFMHSTLTTKRGVDESFVWLYRHVARPIYTRPVLGIISFLLIAGIGFFAYFFFVKHISFLISTAGASIQDLLWLILISLASLFLHEIAHGLTVKAYGRKVLRAGLMVYIGMPLAYVDTTDIWMKSRWPRMAVSFAGPACNGLIASILFLIAIFLPDGTARHILILVGMLNTIIFIFNLLPVAETDGHYIIQDYLEMPRLRPRSFAFLRRGMWHKLAQRERWEKNDSIYLGYGLVAIFGLALLLCMAAELWFNLGDRLVQAIADRPLLLAEILSVLVGFAVIVAVVRHGRPLVRRAVSVRRVLETRIGGR